MINVCFAAIAVIETSHINRLQSAKKRTLALGALIVTPDNLIPFHHRLE
jgi:hypothetical protein